MSITIRGGRGRTPLRRAAILSSAATALALVLSGCSLGPDLPRPDVATPKDWAAAEGKMDVWPAADWWREFRSPALDRLMADAMRANFDLGAAIARVRQANAQARIAGAALLPTIGAQGSVTRARSPSLNPFTGQRQSVFSTSPQLGLNASYVIDFWGGNRAALTAAEASAQASRYDAATVAVTIESNVAQTYFEILALADRVAVAEDNLKAADRILGIIRARATAGVASELDVAEQESVVAVQRAQLPPLRQQLQQTTNALAILVARPPEDIEVPKGSLSRMHLPAVTAGLPSGLLARRPDIQAAEARLVAANANIHVARAAFYPTIQLTGAAGFASTALETTLAPASFFWNLAAGLTQPIFEGGRLRGQLELQKAVHQELVENYRKAVIQSFVDVENALVAAKHAADRERYQADAVAKARRAYNISEAQLRAGTVDLVSVLNVQQTLFQAQDVLAQARLARFQSIVSLFQALGGGWDKESIVPATAGADAAATEPAKAAR